MPTIRRALDIHFLGGEWLGMLGYILIQDVILRASGMKHTHTILIYNKTVVYQINRKHINQCLMSPASSQPMRACETLYTELKSSKFFIKRQKQTSKNEGYTAG